MRNGREWNGGFVGNFTSLSITFIIGEEAIDAYYRALEINPSFVRGRYNLGVSCINIGCYKEAAEHLLGALSMHVVDGQSPTISSDPSGGNNGHKNVSQNLWDTLRRTFILVIFLNSTVVSSYLFLNYSLDGSA